jgi:MFS family permease
MKSTIITEYNFVCDKNYYFEVGYSIEQSGYVFGIVIFSRLADKIGRKPIFTFVLFCMSAIGISQYFVRNFYVFTALGFLLNLFATGIDSVSIPLVIEMFTIKKRSVYGIGLGYVWVIVMVFLAPISYFISTWREIRLFVFGVLGVSAFMSFWLVQESLTWLISVNRLDRASIIIDRFARINQLTNEQKFQKQKQELNEMFEILKNFNKSPILAEKIESNLNLKTNEHPRTNAGPSQAEVGQIFRNKTFLLVVLILMFNA